MMTRAELDARVRAMVGGRNIRIAYNDRGGWVNESIEEFFCVGLGDNPEQLVDVKPISESVIRNGGVVADMIVHNPDGTTSYAYLMNARNATRRSC